MWMRRASTPASRGDPLTSAFRQRVSHVDLPEGDVGALLLLENLLLLLENLLLRALGPVQLRTKGTEQEQQESQPP